MTKALQRRGREYRRQTESSASSSSSGEEKPFIAQKELPWSLLSKLHRSSSSEQIPNQSSAANRPILFIPEDLGRDRSLESSQPTNTGTLSGRQANQQSSEGEAASSLRESRGTVSIDGKIYEVLGQNAVTPSSEEGAVETPSENPSHQARIMEASFRIEPFGGRPGEGFSQFLLRLKIKTNPTLKYYDSEEERREVKLMMLIDNLKDDALRFMNDNRT